MAQQVVQLMPDRQALGDVVRRFGPGFGQAHEFVVTGEQLQQLRVADCASMASMGVSFGTSGAGAGPPALAACSRSLASKTGTLACSSLGWQGTPTASNSLRILMS
jgi:hypothetical protein